MVIIYQFPLNTSCSKRLNKTVIWWENVLFEQMFSYKTYKELGIQSYYFFKYKSCSKKTKQKCVN